MPDFYYVPSSARRTSRRWMRLAVFIALLLGFSLAGLSLVPSPEANAPTAGLSPRLAGPGNTSLWGIVSGETLKKVLRHGMPLMALTGEEAGVRGQGVGDLVQSAIYSLIRVDVRNPKTLLVSQMAMLDNGAVAAPVLSVPSSEIEDEGGQDAGSGKLIDVPPADEEAPPPPALPTPVITSNAPLVGIYNTHNAETYIPTDGNDKLEGKNAGVVKVAEKLQWALENRYGVKTVRAETIHDYPDWAKSYANSEKTVRELLGKNPSLQVLLDIHRDAGLSERQVVKVNGVEAARVLLIVGSNTRLEHPYWKKNLDFARQVAAKMEALYPGLLKGVRVQDGRYNQHLHPRAILLEIGSTKNSLEEAQRAAELMAHVIAEVVKELAGQSTP